MPPTPEKSYTFRKHEHLLRPADFQRVYETKCSSSDHLLLVYGAANGLPHARLGLSVSRKVGGAVVRNRLRRLYREAFRLTKCDLPAGIDFILIPRRGDAVTLDGLMKSLPKLARQVAKRVHKEARST